MQDKVSVFPPFFSYSLSSFPYLFSSPAREGGGVIPQFFPLGYQYTLNLTLITNTYNYCDTEYPLSETFGKKYRIPW